MRFFLCILAITLVNGANVSDPWNTLLRSNNLFSNEIQLTRSSDTTAILTQLKSLLDDSTILNKAYATYLTQFEKPAGWSQAQVFAATLMEIASHNLKYEAGDSTWYKAVNQFTDMTNEQAREATGVQMKEFLPLETQTPNNTFHAGLFAAPDTLDYRTSPKLTTDVKHQGNCGSCWAFAVNGMLEAAMVKKFNRILNLSEQELVDCNTQNGGCNGGAYVYALDYLKNTGVTLTSSYKYEATKKSCRRSGSSAAKAQSWGRIDRNENALKEGAATYGPIAVSLLCGSNAFYQYGGGVFASDCGTGGHAVIIVGYESDSWIIKNSWGVSWGEKGFMRLKRGVDQCKISSREGGYYITV